MSDDPTRTADRASAPPGGPSPDAAGEGTAGPSRVAPRVDEVEDTAPTMPLEPDGATGAMAPLEDDGFEPTVIAEISLAPAVTQSGETPWRADNDADNAGGNAGPFGDDTSEITGTVLVSTPAFDEHEWEPVADDGDLEHATLRSRGRVDARPGFIAGLDDPDSGEGHPMGGSAQGSAAADVRDDAGMAADAARTQETKRPSFEELHPGADPAPTPPESPPPPKGRQRSAHDGGFRPLAPAGDGATFDDGDNSDDDLDAGGEHTVMLDPEMQDRLMALRAQQDFELKQKFEGDVAVMFTDLVGSTAYYEKHGDLMGRQKMLTHNALLFPIIRARRGTIIKTIGDAIMCCFDDVDAALAAAEKMQQALRSFNDSCTDPDEEIHIRIGLNAGPAIAEDGDLHGDAVNVAARVESKADGDEILVSESVRKLAARDDFELKGRVALKGKAERMGVYRLLWGDAEPSGAHQVGPRVVGGRYELSHTIGRGPDGVVYAAEDTQLRVPVALKLLHDFVIEDTEVTAEFRDRFLALASLRHDGIVRLLDFSAPDADEPFYVMDRIDGADLSAWVTKNGATDPQSAALIVHDLCKAVAHAHEHGILHSNIKPENVFMRDDGRPVLGDFGITAVRRAGGTVTGGSVASPAFQAPEQVTGAEVLVTTDVYALGGVLYFLLAGRPPYEMVASLKNMQAVCSGLYKRLPTVRSGLPRRLIQIAERAMATKPSDRYPSTQAMLEDLAAFCGMDARLASGSVGAAPPAVADTAPSFADLPDVPRGGEVTLPAGSATPVSDIVKLRTALIAVSITAAASLLAVIVLTVVLLTRDPAAPFGTPSVTAEDDDAGVAAAESEPSEVLQAGAAAPPAAAEADELGDDLPAGAGTPVDAEASAGSAKAAHRSAIKPSAKPSGKPVKKAPAQPGKLSLASQPPGADVFIDQKKVGRTPLRELDLDPGSYELLVVHPKRLPHVEQIEVPAGGAVKRRVRLKAK